MARMIAIVVHMMTLVPRLKNIWQTPSITIPDIMTSILLVFEPPQNVKTMPPTMLPAPMPTIIVARVASLLAVTANIIGASSIMLILPKKFEVK